ncbi:unnamed protein product [Prorocentrum cordatum]|uniref:ABC transporter domain-containing protein n=1 Tax=Prorocentrum cordatum TaxID=2364126 RepID=A0ABN9XU63_9DINO|nr:unnamed protein product [Polarella glacialis]
MATEWLEAQLDRKVIGNVTLAEQLQQLDAAEEAERVRGWLVSAQSCDVANVTGELEKARQGYLDSALRRMLEGNASRLDSELARQVQEFRSQLSGELSQLWDYLQGEGSSASGWLVEYVERNLNDTCHLQGPLWNHSCNTSELASNLQLASVAMEHFQGWIENVTGIEVSWLDWFGNLSAIEAETSWLRNLTLAGAWSLGQLDREALQELADQAKSYIAEVAAQVEGYLNNASTGGEYAYQLPIGAFAQADRIVLWTSHFLKPASASLEFLEEVQAVASMAASEPEPEPEPETELLDLAQEFDTQVVQKLYEMIDYWTKANQTDKAIEYIEQFCQELNRTIDVALELRVEYDHEIQVSFGFLDSLRSALADLEGLNASAIEANLVPQWADQWQVECERVNASAIADFIERMRDDCPLCVQMLNLTSMDSFSYWVAMAHDWIEGVDLSALEANLTQWQVLLQGVDPDEVYNVTLSFLQAFQLEEVEEGISVAAQCAETLFQDLRGRAEQWLDANLSCDQPLELDLDFDWSWDNLSWWEGFQQLGGQTFRRLQRRDDGDEDDVEGMDWLVQGLLAQRKLLVAPYKGDAKKLFENMIAEVVLSLTDWRHLDLGELNRLKDWDAFGEAMEGFLAWVRGGAAMAVEWALLDGFMLTFDSESEMLDWVKDHPTEVIAGLVFDSVDADGNLVGSGVDVRYKVRMDQNILPATTRLITRVSGAMLGRLSSGTSTYETVFFVHLQEAMARAASRLEAQRRAPGGGGEARRASAAEGPGECGVGCNAFANDATEASRSVSVSLQHFPQPGYEEDNFIYIIQYMLPFFMVIGWLYVVSLLVSGIVYEKQERLREVMRIQGLRTWVYWTGWWVSAMTQMALVSAVIMLMMSGGGVFKYSDPFLIFVFFLVYSASTISLAMLISACFNRAMVAAVCAGVLYYTLYIPYSPYNRFEPFMGTPQKMAYCLLSPTALGVGTGIIAKWELDESGLTWGNLFKPYPISNQGTLPLGDFSMGHVLLMLIVDIVLYQLLGWYIEKVFPGELGLPQPWYFLLMPSYWKSKVRQPTGAAVAAGPVAEQKDNKQLVCWEAAADDLVPTAQIRNLAKTFAGVSRCGGIIGKLCGDAPPKRALKGISLDLHKGTVLGLLGHNGAGKSTTMSILTGIYPPTEGDVYVNGHSVSADSQKVREQLGVCLQSNALYNVLTCEEHLSLFCSLKGVPRSRVQADVTSLLESIGLTAKRSAMSKALSGGMKRRLSIGIALSGGSSIVALDEPTAGVDAGSRRDIWHILAGQKASRAILLSTHFMDEADVLSDRIAIIAEGELVAIGSSMALKRHFADSYLLTVVASDSADPALLLAAVRESVPQAEAAGSRGREHSFVLPNSARPLFATLFASLQDADRRKRLGVDTYGLSAATMEEVFLQASSTREEGLRGRVRNAGQAIEAPPQKSPAGSDSGSDAGTKTPSSSSGKGAGSSEDHAESGSNSGQSGDSPQSKCRMASVADGKEASPSSVHETFPGAGGKDPVFSPSCMVTSPPPEQAPQLGDGSAQPAKVPAGLAKQAEQASFETVGGPVLSQQQFRARLWMRLVSIKRDRKAWASQLVMPASLIFVAMIAATVILASQEQPALKLSTEVFTEVSWTGKHDLLIFDDPADANGQQMAQLLEQSTAASESAVMLDTQRYQQGMGQYLMDHAYDLTTSFGAVSVDDTSGTTGVASSELNLWFKSQHAHAVPALMNLASQARFRMMGQEQEVSSQVYSHPLPQYSVDLEEEQNGGGQAMLTLLVALTVIVAMGFIPASFVVNLVHERITDSKHQQLLAGLSQKMYWMSHYASDMLNFMIPVVFCWLQFVFFQIEAYSGENSFAVLMVLTAYGVCMSPFMYCWEGLFQVPSMAYVSMICINIFLGTTTTLATSTMDILENELPEVKPWNAACKQLFPVFVPSYNLGRGLIEIATNHFTKKFAADYELCQLDSLRCGKSPLDWDVGGEYLFWLLIMAPAWFMLRLFLEWRVFQRRGLKSSPAQRDASDEAVQEEAARVAEGRSSPHAGGKDALVIWNLSKTFRTGRGCCRKAAEVRSVRGISVGVAPGECFGLLGVNGAGKTTTMRMITGDTEIGGGDVTLGGWSIRNRRDKARKHLGYCPQFDALPDKLTTRQTLVFYALLRGVAPSKVGQVVDSMIGRMCLEAHEHRLTQHLSGGNKRKLSTALALIGEPDVVLLDEPSTGIDVGARRFLWDFLGEIRQRGHALVLTSHSMDECEVLCTRLTVMVHGEFRCLGSPTQLKDKYGGGYTLTIKAVPKQQHEPEDSNSIASPQGLPVDVIRNFITSEVPELTGLSQRAVSLSDLFAKLEGAMQDPAALKGIISDYTISQTSLEEVFLHFSKEVEQSVFANALGDEETASKTSASRGTQSV